MRLPTIRSIITRSKAASRPRDRAEMTKAVLPIACHSHRNGLWLFFEPGAEQSGRIVERRGMAVLGP